MSDEQNNSLIELNGEQVSVDDLLRHYEALEKENASLVASQSKARLKHDQDETLKPFQAELIRMQRYLEDTTDA